MIDERREVNESQSLLALEREIEQVRGDVRKLDEAIEHGKVAAQRKHDVSAQLNRLERALRLLKGERVVSGRGSQSRRPPAPSRPSPPEKSEPEKPES